MSLWSSVVLVWTSLSWIVPSAVATTNLTSVNANRSEAALSIGSIFSLPLASFNATASSNHDTFSNTANNNSKSKAKRVNTSRHYGTFNNEVEGNEAAGRVTRPLHALRHRYHYQQRLAQAVNDFRTDDEAPAIWPEGRAVDIPVAGMAINNNNNAAEKYNLMYQKQLQRYVQIQAALDQAHSSQPTGPTHRRRHEQYMRRPQSDRLTRHPDLIESRQGHRHHLRHHLHHAHNHYRAASLQPRILDNQGRPQESETTPPNSTPVTTTTPAATHLPSAMQHDKEWNWDSDAMQTTNGPHHHQHHIRHRHHQPRPEQPPQSNWKSAEAVSRHGRRIPSRTGSAVHSHDDVGKSSHPPSGSWTSDKTMSYDDTNGDRESVDNNDDELDNEDYEEDEAEAETEDYEADDDDTLDMDVEEGDNGNDDDDADHHVNNNEAGYSKPERRGLPTMTSHPEPYSPNGELAMGRYTNPLRSLYQTFYMSATALPAKNAVDSEYQHQHRHRTSINDLVNNAFGTASKRFPSSQHYDGANDNSVNRSDDPTLSTKKWQRIVREHHRKQVQHQQALQSMLQLHHLKDYNNISHHLQLAPIRNQQRSVQADEAQPFPSSPFLESQTNNKRQALNEVSQPASQPAGPLLLLAL